MLKKTVFLLYCSLLGTFASPALADDDDDDDDDESVGFMALQYGVVGFKSQGGKTISMPSIRVNMFDTSGGLTAGLRGAMNQNVAQKNKEAEIVNAAKEGRSGPEGSNVANIGGNLSGSYNYSWNQPAPNPSDGDTWILTAATDGTPIIDAISTPSAATKIVNSMLGLEFSRALWTSRGPISIAAGWGMKFFLFDGGIKANSASLPLNISVATNVAKGLVAYNDFAISPYGLIKSTGYYLHDQWGLNWTFAEDWMLTLSYRIVKDVTDVKDNDGKFYEYEMTDIYGGIAYKF